jgi:hypothetical protein
MFEQTFKNIDDILHKDAGCSSEPDYVEQTSWILHQTSDKSQIRVQRCTWITA